MWSHNYFFRGELVTATHMLGFCKQKLHLVRREATRKQTPFNIRYCILAKTNLHLHQSVSSSSLMKSTSLSTIPSSFSHYMETWNTIIVVLVHSITCSPPTSRLGMHNVFYVQTIDPVNYQCPEQIIHQNHY